jgi:hypothetical protein
MENNFKTDREERRGEADRQTGRQRHGKDLCLFLN